jgi:hypothetical protein
LQAVLVMKRLAEEDVPHGYTQQGRQDEVNSEEETRKRARAL